MESHGSSLEHLRTVEFRESLRGYNRDDVDDFLERVAVDVDALQQRLVQLSEQARLATERAARAEQGEPRPQRVQPDPQASEALSRTLLMAQEFVDHVKREAEQEAAALVQQAEGRARSLLQEAEDTAHQITGSAEARARDEVERLEERRAELVNDVEMLNRHLEGERARLQASLVELVRWLDKGLKSAGTARQSGAAQPSPSPRQPANGSVPAGDDHDARDLSQGTRDPGSAAGGSGEPGQSQRNASSQGSAPAYQPSPSEDRQAALAEQRLQPPVDFSGASSPEGIGRVRELDEVSSYRRI